MGDGLLAHEGDVLLSRQANWRLGMVETRRVPDAVTPFQIRVGDEEIEDLHRRLRSTRFIAPPAVSDWSSGVPVAYLRELLEYWERAFDWRTEEARLNAFTHLRVVVDGVAMHCVHVRGSGVRPIPIVLVHGWPSSFVEMLDLASLLADPARGGGDAADAFDVVVPSLPGFAYSDAPQAPGWTSADNGRLVARAMRALGYERFAVHAYDVAASAMTAFCLSDPACVIGYHTTEPAIPGPYPVPERASLGAEERAYLALADEWDADEGAYFAMLRTRPLTLGHALNDSPAGLAAWIVEKWWSWTVAPGSGRRLHDAIPMERVLSNIAIYWHTRTINSANWLYHAGRRPRVAGEQARVPVGVALTSQPIERAPRSWAERFFPDIRRWVDLGPVGHFVAAEQPTGLAAAVRDFFRPLRP
jgi:pimeloyl-ACP methyl ester carboxylesterase